MVPDPVPRVAGASEEARASERQVLAAALQLYRPLDRAARLARANGAGYLAFGVLTALFSLDDAVALVLGAVLLGVGLWERKQARRLLAGELDAPARLALGELVLLGAIVVYAGLRITVLGPSSEELERELGPGGRELSELADTVSQLTYAMMIGVSLLYQGGFALYFQRRRPLLQRYLTQSPGWAREAAEGLRL